MKFEINDGDITISKDNISITLTGSELSELNNKYNREIYFREDVETQIDELIECGELPKNAGYNKDFAESVLDEYTRLRNDNDGITDGMDWSECLNMAFDSVKYDSFSKEEKVIAFANEINFDDVPVYRIDSEFYKIDVDSSDLLEIMGRASKQEGAEWLQNKNLADLILDDNFVQEVYTSIENSNVELRYAALEQGIDVKIPLKDGESAGIIKAVDKAEKALTKPLEAVSVKTAKNNIEIGHD